MPKYVRTIDNEIIVFPDSIMHSDFKYTKPVSAGFIQFFILNDNVKCRCYGESISLGLISNQQEDTKLAQYQISEIN